MRKPTQLPRVDNKKFGFQRNKWKFSEDFRERVYELLALGCTDGEVSRLCRKVITPECVRAMRISVGTPINRKTRPTFSGSCVKCQSECDPVSPVCGECFRSVPPHIRERIQTSVRTQTRTVAEKRALYYLEYTVTEAK